MWQVNIHDVGSQFAVRLDNVQDSLSNFVVQALTKQGFGKADSGSGNGIG
jgi:hypothetical protein